MLYFSAFAIITIVWVILSRLIFGKNITILEMGIQLFASLTLTGVKKGVAF